MKLRIDEIDEDTSPLDIRELLEVLGEVGEVTINYGQHCMYALADMNYHDAEEAIDAFDKMQWRGQQISVQSADHVYGRGWISGHDWKPPKKKKDF